MAEWKKLARNQILDGDEVDGQAFYVSYNQAPCVEFSFFASDTRGPETALYLVGEWFILNGDFREEYEAAFPDPMKCLAVYDKHKAEHRSSWSTDDLDVDWFQKRITNVLKGGQS